jgi:hypothetical protein
MVTLNLSLSLFAMESSLNQDSSHTDDHEVGPSKQPSFNQSSNTTLDYERPISFRDSPSADFIRGIDLCCNLCNQRILNEQLITKLPCACQRAYHHACLTTNDYIRNYGCVISGRVIGHCPTCSREFTDRELLDYGLHFRVKLEELPLEPDKVSAVTPSPSAGLHSAASGPTQANTPNAALLRPPLHGQHIVLDALAAFIYGITAEHMWSKQDFSKTQRTAGLGILGLSLIPLHASLYRQNPHHIPHRTCAWIIGSLLGFLTPQLLKKTAPATCPPQPSK